jgi:hypothetical protein
MKTYSKQVKKVNDLENFRHDGRNHDVGRDRHPVHRNVPKISTAILTSFSVDNSAQKWK